MTGLDFDLDDRIDAGGLQSGHPLERLDVQHARIVHRRGGEDTRERPQRLPLQRPRGRRARTGLAVRALRRVFVWRIRFHVPVDVRVVQRIAPLVPLGDGQRQRRIEDRRQRIHERHIRLDARIQLRRHVRNRTHQQTAGGTAVRHRPMRIGQPRVLQRGGHVDEVLERVPLVQAPPLLIPGASHLAAAAHVRHGVQHAAVEQAQASD